MVECPAGLCGGGGVPKLGSVTAVLPPETETPGTRTVPLANFPAPPGPGAGELPARSIFADPGPAALAMVVAPVLAPEGVLPEAAPRVSPAPTPSPPPPSALEPSGTKARVAFETFGVA